MIDSELFDLARAGCIESRNALIRKHIGLVWRMAGPNDDYYCACVDALMRCVKLFDPTRGIKFSTYACNAMARAIWSVKKYGYGSSRSESAAWWKNNSVSMDDGEYDRFHRRFMIEDDVDHDGEAERVRESVASAVAELPSKHQRVIFGRMTGESLGDIGACLGLTKEAIRKIEQQAIQRLRERFGVKHKGNYSIKLPMRKIG